MDDLIVRVLAGDAVEFERRRLDEWRAASPANERHFRELEQLWRLTAPVASPRPSPAPPPLAAIVAEAERRRSQVAPLGRRWPVRPWWAVAAAAVVVLAVGSYRLARPAEQLYATPAGATLTVPLADGSIVRLGPESRLRVRRSDARRVSLSGMAFFAVASDSTHPFVVRAARGDVRVLGTRFELRAGADSLRLVVVEGRVRLTGGGGEVEAGRGVVARIAAGARPTVESGVDLERLLDWPSGLLVFQNTPLELAMEEIGAHFHHPFVILDTGLAARTVTAWFADEPYDEVVSTVCQVVGARCAVGDTLLVRR